MDDTSYVMFWLTNYVFNIGLFHQKNEANINLNYLWLSFFMSLGLFMNIYIIIDDTSFLIFWSMNSGLNYWHFIWLQNKIYFIGHCLWYFHVSWLIFVTSFFKSWITNTQGNSWHLNKKFINITKIFNIQLSFYLH